jgi:hypothetical protein
VGADVNTNYPKKHEVFDAFEGKISRKAINDGACDKHPGWDEYGVTGKWCRITWVNEDLEWDVWIVNTRDLTKPLHTLKIDPLVEKLTADPEEVSGEVIRWDGEAQVRLKSVAPILANLSALGIRKKREISQDQLDAMKEQLSINRSD